VDIDTREVNLTKIVLEITANKDTPQLTVMKVTQGLLHYMNVQLATAGHPDPVGLLKHMLSNPQGRVASITPSGGKKR
jgi:hypothetical protein